MIRQYKDKLTLWIQVPSEVWLGYDKKGVSRTQCLDPQGQKNIMRVSSSQLAPARKFWRWLHDTFLFSRLHENRADFWDLNEIPHPLDGWNPWYSILYTINVY